MSTTITYNGTDISLEDGQTLTLHCAETVFASDIQINADGQATINYGGQSIVSLEKGQSLTLHCSGLRAKSDISIVAIAEVIPEEPETYVIPEGTYVFNETLDVAKSARGIAVNGGEILMNYYDGDQLHKLYQAGSIEFFAAGESYTGCSSVYCHSWDDYYNVYNNGDSQWMYRAEPTDDYGNIPNEYLLACRTIDITTDIEVSADFYEVFIANVKKRFYFTIDADAYLMLEGMTWVDWCDSEYNTAGFYYTEVSVFDAKGNIVGINDGGNIPSPLCPTEVIDPDIMYMLG